MALRGAAVAAGLSGLAVLGVLEARAEPSGTPVELPSIEVTAGPHRKKDGDRQRRASAARRTTAPRPAAPPAARVPTAGTGADRQEDGYQPLRASTATRTDAPLIDIPQAIAVVPRQALVDQQVRTLDEALYNVSGITQANTLGGTQDAVMKRGFGDNRDGSILRDSFRTILPSNFSASADRVEVLKGPSSMLYGILDPGGVINIISKKPQLQGKGSLSGNWSSFNGGGATIDLTGPIGADGLAYRVIGDYQDKDYWRNFGKIQRSLIAPSLSWYGEKTTVHVAYEHSEYKIPFDRGTVIDTRTGRPVDIPRERRLDAPYNVTRGSTDMLTATIEHALDDNWRLRAGYFYNHSWYKDNQARVLSVNFNTGVATRRADATQDSNIDQQIARLELVGKFMTGPVRHEILIGTEHEETDTLRTDMIRGPNTTTFNIYNPDYGVMPASTRVSASESDQTERIKAQAAYLQDSIHLTDDFIVVGGLRYQQFHQVAGRGRPFVTNTDVEGGKAVPRVGAVYKIRPDTSLYVDYGQSFRPNSSISSYVGALPPEQGRSIEAGIKLETPGGITATAAVFDIVKSNVLYTEVVDGINVNRTAGRVGSRGFELDVAGRISENWSLIGTYSYLDARVLEDPTLTGKRLNNVAAHNASLFLTYDFGEVFAGRLRAGIGERYVGARAGDAANSFFLPAYYLTDAFVSYKTTHNGLPVTWQLNARNIFDRTYYPSGLSTTVVAIGDPREITLQARVEF